MNPNLTKYVAKYKPLIDQEIAGELDQRLAQVREISPHLVKIIEAMKELSVGGKRLRGILTILGYEISGGTANSEIIKAASAMELFHLGLLIQDDFMDKDGLRRGVPTIIARYDDSHVGNFVSMLAGDYTFGWGIEILSALDLSADKVNRTMKVWGKYFTRVGYGQTLDGLAVADEDTLLKILALKSGEYSCVLPLQLGATLGGADEQTIQKLYEYGMELGWVFQLRDDWLGEYGDPAKTGKPVGNDSREGKHTYATMYGRENTEAEIIKKVDLGILTLRGLSLKVGEMRELLEWMATREN